MCALRTAALAAGLSSAFFALTAAPATAEASDSGFFVEGVAELEAQWLLNQSHPDNGIAALTVEIAAGLALGSGWSLAGGVLLEPVLEPLERDHFDAEGLFLDSLILQHVTDYSTLFAGKFAPAFGTAWDVTPGVFGTEIGEGYELAGFLGVGGDLALGRIAGLSGGELVLSWSAFTADTSPFSNSVLRERGRARLADGGLANTGGLDSYALALDAYDVLAEGVHLHLAARNLATDEVGLTGETALVAGVVWVGELDAGGEIALNLEWVHFDHPGGLAGEGDAFTTGVAGQFGDWRVSASHAWSETRGGPAPSELRITEFSAGYDFSQAYGLDIGVMRFEDELESGTVLKTVLTCNFGN